MGDSELVSKTIQIENKLFYLDLKENPRGRYLKISEKTSTSRSTIIVPFAALGWFLDLFTYYANGEEELSSKELQYDSKIFYFDVGDNNRGRFLKISEASVSRNRSTIIIPCGISGTEGWSAFRNVLVEIHDATQLLGPPATNIPLQNIPMVPSYVPVSPPQQPPPPEGFTPQNPVAPVPAAVNNQETARVIRAEQKKFFFDLGSNSRGQFLKISEVIGGDRSSIILPASAIEQFHEALGHFVEVVRGQGLTANNHVNVRTVAPIRKRTEG